MNYITDFSPAQIERRSAERLEQGRKIAFRASLINVVFFALGILFAAAFIAAK